MVLLSPSEIDNVLSESLDRLSLALGPYPQALFLLLYDFGFRFSELLKLHEWELNQDGTVICHTLKGSNDRIHNLIDFPYLIQKSIIDGENYNVTMSYRNYERIFQKSTTGKLLVDGAKSIGTHLFRHNLIKKMSSDGNSIAAIKLFTGIKSDAIVQGYISSKIYQLKY